MLLKAIMLFLYFLRYSLPKHVWEQNKQVKKMYIMDIYSVKQPQNIIIKVKMKEHEIGKKEYILEKSWMKYILLPLFCLWQALFTSGKAVHLTWYEFRTYTFTNYNHLV